MIKNDNEQKYAFCTYESILYFLMEIYKIDKNSETSTKLKEDITDILEKGNIDYKENELKIAIIVFAIMESMQSNKNLNNSLNLFGTTLYENNISTALELEYFLLNNENEDLSIIKQIIEGRNSQKLKNFKVNATMSKKGKTITVEQNGAKIKITD